MSKLPHIFHNNIRITSNNKNSFNTFDNKKKEEITNNINKDSLINYFNKPITVVLKSSEEINGKLISKRDDTILLDTGDYIKIKDIMCIK